MVEVANWVSNVLGWACLVVAGLLVVVVVGVVLWYGGLAVLLGVVELGERWGGHRTHRIEGSAAGWQVRCARHQATTTGSGVLPHCWHCDRRPSARRIRRQMGYELAAIERAIGDLEHRVEQHHPAGFDPVAAFYDPALTSGRKPDGLRMRGLYVRHRSG